MSKNDEIRTTQEMLLEALGTYAQELQRTGGEAFNAGELDAAEELLERYFALVGGVAGYGTPLNPPPPIRAWRTAGRPCRIGRRGEGRANSIKALQSLSHAAASAVVGGSDGTSTRGRGRERWRVLKDGLMGLSRTVVVAGPARRQTCGPGPVLAK
jgi:hypothetical protein